MKKILFVLQLLFAVSLSAQNADAGLDVAIAQLKLGERDKAIVSLTELIRVNGSKEDYYFYRATARLQQGNFDLAKQDLQHAIGLNPACARCYGNLGVIELETQHYYEAISWFEKSIELDARKSMTFIKRGEAYYHLGRYAESIADFDYAMKLDSATVDYCYLWKAMNQLASGNPGAALIDINRSISTRITDYALFIRAKCLVQLQRPQEAWTDISQSIKSNEDVAEFQHLAGVILYNLHDYRKSLDVLSKAIKLDSTNAVTFRYRGYVLFELGQFSESCRDRQKALQLMQQTGASRDDLIYMLKEIDDYCNMQRVNPYRHIGTILTKYGVFNTAIETFNAGIKLFPTDPTLHEGLANALNATGKSKQAITEYQSALASMGWLNASLLPGDPNSDLESIKDNFSATIYTGIAYSFVNITRFDSAAYYQGLAITLLYDNPKIVGRDSLMASYYVKRGSIYFLNRDFIRMQNDIDSALKIKHDFPDALRLSASYLLQKNSTVSKSIRPTAAYATILKPGGKQAEVKDALEKLDTVIHANPNDADAYILRARAKLMLGDLTARSDAEKAKALGFTNALKWLGF